jgi:hypothetical protein
MRDVDIKRRGSGATVDARAMVIVVVRPLGWIITVEDNRIECICHLNNA